MIGTLRNVCLRGIAWRIFPPFGVMWDRCWRLQNHVLVTTLVFSASLLYFEVQHGFQNTLSRRAVVYKRLLSRLTKFSMGRCHRKGRNRQGKFRFRYERKIRSWDDNRRRKAIFWPGRRKLKDRSEGGEDVTRSTTSQGGRVCCRLSQTGRYHDGVRVFRFPAVRFRC